MYLIILFELKYFSLPYFQLHTSQVLEKDDQQIPVKDDQQSNEESEADDDMVPVEIRPGHIRFQPRGKGF